MKLTKKDLKKVIIEELKNIHLNEIAFFGGFPKDYVPETEEDLKKKVDIKKKEALNAIEVAINYIKYYGDDIESKVNFVKAIEKELRFIRVKK